MRILIAHNAYQQRGGEDAVVEAEIALLREHGHDVELYSLHNDAINGMSKAGAAMTAVWSRRSSQDISEACERFRPDVVHVHNTFPLISPSLYWAASRQGVPVVQTLHNFRLLCPQAIFLRDGRICEDCLGKLPWRSVARKCYRDSAAQTAVVAGMLTAHRLLGSYRERVTRYIALNAFARDKYVEGGLPAERFRIKPNFVCSTGRPPETPRHGGLYVGRLSHEKGLDVLAGAMRLLDGNDISIVGSGPLEPVARNAAGERYAGYLALDEILQHMRTARYLVLPSICYENSPRTIVEAFSCGLPVIASRLGALAGIVRDGVTGLLFEPGDARDLAAKIAWADSHPEDMARMGRAAYADYLAQYTPERNHDILMDIYEDAIAATERGKHAAHAA